MALPLPEIRPTFGHGWQTIELVKAPMPRARELDWPSLLRRTFATRIFDCACGGRRQVVAFVTDTAKALEILEELGLPAEAPKLARARGPPPAGAP
jgi:hypothetical protein